MKRFSCYLFTLLGLGAFFSCKKDKKEETPAYSCATCVRTPEARAQHDNLATGIYKGTVIGSSGTIKFDLANNGNTMTAVMTINNVTVNLSANITYTAGAPIVGDFTGTWPVAPGGPVSVRFQVGASGANPTVVSSSIPGHANAVFTVYKETSSSLIEAFEGTYDKPDAGNVRATGRFNIIMARAINGFSGVARKNGDSSVSRFSGTISGNNWNVTSSSSSQVGGTINGDVLTGSIRDQYGTGSVTGNRTL